MAEVWDANEHREEDVDDNYQGVSNEQILDDNVDDDDDEDEEEEDILDMEEAPTVQQDALLMRFCPHDSSMLYPQVRTRIKVQRK